MMTKADRLELAREMNAAAGLRTAAWCARGAAERAVAKGQRAKVGELMDLARDYDLHARSIEQRYANPHTNVSREFKEQIAA